MTTRFRVAICGGGICGLTLAAVLNKFSHDIQVDIFEAAATFSEVGAGINIWRRTWRIMEILGLSGGLRELAVEPPTEEEKPGFTFRKSDQPEEGFGFFTLMMSYGPIGMHRADFLKLIQSALTENTSVHFSKRLRNYEETNSNSVLLEFVDGSTAEAEALIGCDGIKSNTRAAMYTHAAENESDVDVAEHLLRHITPVWTGNLAYRALFDTDKLMKRHPGHRVATDQLMYLGKNKHIVAYPIAKGRLVNLVCFVTNMTGEGTIYEGVAGQSVTREEVIEHFRGWEPEAESLTQCGIDPLVWPINAVRPLPFYVRGRVALSGDAAHAMSTHIGAGAGQSIEDAFILGRILSHPKVRAENIDTALKVYQSVRQPIAKRVAEQSRMSGLLYEFNAPGFENSELSRDEFKALGDMINNQWCWQWKTVPDQDWVLAERKLQERLAGRLSDRALVEDIATQLSRDLFVEGNTTNNVLLAAA